MQLRSKLFYSYLFFLVIYSCFTLLPAPSPIALALYHVSATGLRIIDATVILLLAAIWFAGFYGYAKLRQYSQLIRKERDGKHVATLTRGIFLMVMWLPASFTISAVLNYIAAHHLGWVPAVAIINNYISLAFPLLGVIFIGIGARGLSDTVKQRPSHLANSILVALLIYIGLIYYRLVGTTANRDSVYHMSRWLVLLTIVAPYVFMWFTGVLATHEIFNYRQKVAGVVYRSSWKLLALGIGWLMVLSIAVQYLLTTLVSRLSHLSIYWILVIIYLLLLVYSVGFILIALGARKLQKIEEV